MNLSTITEKETYLQGFRNLYSLIECEIPEEIANPYLNVSSVQHVIVKLQRESNDIEDACLSEDYCRAQRELVDMLTKGMVLYYQCLKKGLFLPPHKRAL